MSVKKFTSENVSYLVPFFFQFDIVCAALKYEDHCEGAFIFAWSQTYRNEYMWSIVLTTIDL